MQAEQTMNATTALPPSSFRVVRKDDKSRADVPFWDSITAGILCFGLVYLTFTDWLVEYFNQDIFVAISRFSRAILLGYFLYYLARTGFSFTRYGFRFGGMLFILAISLFVYALFDNHVLEGLYAYVRTLHWIIGIVVAYRLVRSGALTLEKLANAIRAIIVIAVVFTLFYMRTPAFETSYNASAYPLLYTLPLLLMRPKLGAKDLIFLAMAVLGIIVTVKRGAVLGLGASVLTYLVCAFYVTRSARHVTRLIMLSFVLLVAISATAAWRWERIQERTTDEKLLDPQKGGSGRFGLWRRIYYNWSSGDTTVILFGRGNRTHMFTHPNPKRIVHAHSDLFAFLHDQGLYGVLLLGLFHLSYLRILFPLLFRRDARAPSFAMGYVVLCCVNLYSGAFKDPNFLVFALLISYVAGTSAKPPARYFFLLNPPPDPPASEEVKAQALVHDPVS
ncbi:MAG: hypothetical protein PWP23_1245 [Candidatus Sumerlaeota bacterium]|nr:hypothetical protein [Candidatus Sumerlaeota bacterium]